MALQQIFLWGEEYVKDFLDELEWYESLKAGGLEVRGLQLVNYVFWPNGYGGWL